MSTFDLPQGWAETTLGALGRWSSGGTPSRGNSAFYGGKIPWVKTGELQDGVIKATEENITEEALGASAAKVFPERTLLVAMYGATIGKVGILGTRAATNQACAALVAEGLTTDLIPFVFYYLRSRRDELRAAGQGGAQPNISQALLKEFPCRLPPLNEQRRIVAKLEALLARSRRAKEALDAIPALLERFRQSVLAAAFRGDLTRDWREKSPDVEPASKFLERIRTERRHRWEEAELKRMRSSGKVPKDDAWKKKYEEPQAATPLDSRPLPPGWTWVRWSEVGFCQNGRAFPSSEYSNAGVRLLRPGNLHVTGRISWTDENTKLMPEQWARDYPDFIVGPSELVMNLTAQSLKDEFLGRVCLTGSNERCLLNQRIARITPVMLQPSFCLWLFKAADFRRYVDELNTGSLIQHMFTSQVNDFVFPMPPAEEQEVIVGVVQAAMERIERTAAAALAGAACLAALEQATLAAAFRGDLVPQDPADEPASALLDRIRDERESATVAAKSSRTAKLPKTDSKRVA